MKELESQTKRRASGAFGRYLVAICLGVSVTLAWQPYADATKQVIATRAPELGWSPDAKQMIASWFEEPGWTKPLGSDTSPGRQRQPQLPVAQTAPETTESKAPATPSIDPEQVQQMTRSLTALQQSAEQLASTQDQMAHEITRLQAADVEILLKLPAPPPPPPIAAAPAVAGRPAPGGAPSSENTQTEVALRANCGPDVKRLCGGFSRENGGVIKCLSSHRMELSPICVAYFNAEKGAPKATSPNRHP